jgi:PEP-CTERM motif
MRLTRVLALTAAMVALLAGGVAAEPISDACKAAGSATCFQPNLIITGDTGVTLPPLFVEVTNQSGTVVLSMQANFPTTDEFIGMVEMNLDPAINPDALVFTLRDTTSDIAFSDIVITTGTNAINLPPSAGLGGFDIGFDFPPPPGTAKFDGEELIEFNVTCDASIDPTGCALFTTTSFNFAQSDNFRICTHVQGVTGGDGQGSTLVCGTPRSNNVPEPGTIALLGAAATGLAVLIRRKSRR